MIQNSKYKTVLELIKASLWESQIPASIDLDTFNEMSKHRLVAIPTPIFSKLHLSDNLHTIWKKAIYLQISKNVNRYSAQLSLPISVPFLILKGTEAAKYYPDPKCRTLGDIDIFTSLADSDTACEQLLEYGYRYIGETSRETVLIKDGIHIELHRGFAKLNNPKYAQFLDDLIIQNINPTHSLPDEINGLVLLEHISQHLVNGIGLRQIIDWMMFVNKYLPDEKWADFSSLARKIGLEKLAIVTTRMCEMYMGLPLRKWCSNADETLCDTLMIYVLMCGNFGNKRTDARSISEHVMISSRGPISTFKLLQERGLLNWKILNKYPFLRPFAFIYQAGRYLRKGLAQPNAKIELRNAYIESRKYIHLFDALGVRQDSKGLAEFKNGKYVK